MLHLFPPDNFIIASYSRLKLNRTRFSPFSYRSAFSCLYSISPPSLPGYRTQPCCYATVTSDFLLVKHMLQHTRPRCTVLTTSRSTNYSFVRSIHSWLSPYSTVLVLYIASTHTYTSYKYCREEQ